MENPKHPRKSNDWVLPVVKYDKVEVQQIIQECLKICSKDGLAIRRMENVENCFW